MSDDAPLGRPMDPPSPALPNTREATATATPLWVPSAGRARVQVAPEPCGRAASQETVLGVPPSATFPRGPDFAPPAAPYRVAAAAAPPPVPTTALGPARAWPPPTGSPARFQAPARAAQGSNVTVGILALSLVIALIAGSAMVALRTVRLPGGTLPTPTPSATGKAPTTSEPRTRPMPTLTPTMPPVASAPPTHPLYAQTLSGTCTRPKTDATWSAVQKSIQTEAECLDRMWQPIVQASGGQWSAPVLLFYSDPIAKTPCGPTPDKERAPAHYCPGNRTIYVSDAVTDAVVRYRMLGFEVIAHEYTHHVQELVGILDQAHALGRSDLVTRRIELQAHCVAYASMVGMAGLEMSSRELDQLRQTWKFASDPAGHGSAKAQSFWGERGVGATKLSACDTFSASEEQVT